MAAALAATAMVTKARALETNIFVEVKWKLYMGQENVE